MNFIAGQVLDAATMNELASYPKIATLMINQSSGSAAWRSLSFSLLDDPDNMGVTQVDSVRFQLPAGDYFINAPVKSHQTSTCHAKLFNETTGLDISPEVYSYTGGAAAAMNNGVIQVRFTLTATSVLYFAQRSALSTNYTYESHCSITRLR